MTELRKGRQEPTVWYTLPYKETLGDEAIAVYEKTNRVAMEWQKILIRDMLAVEDGLFVHSRFGYSVPRQNGKNEVIAIRELYGLVNGERIIHTAHRTSTSRAAWERLTLLLDAVGIHEKKAANPDGYRSGKSKGQEFIELSEADGGGRIWFRTRTTTGGLGETFDLLVVDEAQEYQNDQESALKYTIATSANPQTIFLGTPPTPLSSGTVFTSYRKDVLSGKKKHAGWAEWSVEEETDVNDVEAWYETNPSLGTKLHERTIEEEVGEDKIDFNIQRLGLWIKYNQKSAISKKEWDALNVLDLPKFKGYLSVGIKFGKDLGNVALSVACKTEDDRIFSECVACRPQREGIDWIIQFLLRLKGNYSKVVVDGASGQEMITKKMKDNRLPGLVLPTVREVIEANAFFEQSVANKTIVHMDQPSVQFIVSNCEHRPIGSNGGFGYKSQKATADVAILDSMIYAIWCCEQNKEFKQHVQRISY